MKVLLVGATSGIGLALGRYYLAHGHTVGLCGRSAELSDLPVRALRYTMDVADQATVRRTVRDFDAAGPAPGIDLVVMCAGIYFKDRSHVPNEQETMAMLSTHLLGLTLVFDAAADVMLRTGIRRGQLVAIASVAGMFRQYPGASLYSATKRRMIDLCDTYRLALEPLGITVTVIAPGYIDTARLRALNGDDASRKPFLMTEDEAAFEIVGAVEAKRGLHVFPRPMRWIVRAFRVLPTALLALRR